MRFWLAVAVGTAAAIPGFLRLPGTLGVTFWLVLVYFTAVGLGTGFFAGRRPALAGALAIYVAFLALTAQANLRGGFGGFDIFRMLGVAANLVIFVFPYAVPAAIGGALGGYARRRVTGGTPRRA